MEKKTNMECLNLISGTAYRSLHFNVGALDGQSFYAGPDGEAELEKDVTEIDAAIAQLKSLIEPFDAAIAAGRREIEHGLLHKTLLCETKLHITEDPGVRAWALAQLRSEFASVNQYGLTKFISGGSNA